MPTTLEQGIDLRQFTQTRQPNFTLRTSRLCSDKLIAGATAQLSRCISTRFAAIQQTGYLLLISGLEKETPMAKKSPHDLLNRLRELNPLASPADLRQLFEDEIE
jgi:hypothetical protein